VAACPERSVRVSTLELFFDLVFVFTVTQLTGVLVEGSDTAATIPLGTEVAAAAQAAALPAIIAAALVADARLQDLTPRRGLSG
jgi:low temperature requirement protein LtrA